MSNLIDIQVQIQKLQKQASEIKAKEFESTVRDIKAKMEAFGITVKDLQGSTSSGKKGRGRPSTKVKGAAKVADSKRKSGGKPVAAKYMGPNGESWSGRGLTPKWLAALVAQGQAKEVFAVKT